MTIAPPESRHEIHRQDRQKRGDAPKPDPDAAAKRARAEVIGRYAAIFIMPLIMVGIMITSYLGTMHAPTPQDMPVVVAGSSAEPVAAQLADAEPDALDVETADAAFDARQQVIDRTAAAAIVTDGSEATLYTAGAAGVSQVRVVTSLVTPALMEQGLTLSSEDLAPLPATDGSGLGAMLLATALVMAGYLPFSVLRSNSPELLQFRRIVPLLAGWAALIAGVVWLITGPVLGVVDSSHTAAVLGIAWLAVFAVGSVQLFITRLLGAFGVVVGILLLMALGMPSSNMAMSIYTMPRLFRFLHDVLPMPAIGESMRSVLYFDGAGVTGHLLTLAIGAAAGLLATKAFDAAKHRRDPDPAPLQAMIPSLHGGPRPRSRFWRYLSLLVFPIAMVTMMVTCMLGAMHEPTPRDMPVAVVGATSEQAEETISGLEENLGGMFDLTAMDDADEARGLVQDRDIVAALVLPDQADPGFTLIANQAGNSSAYQVAEQTFSQVAAAQEMPLTVDDVRPLPASDVNGVVVMYLAMGWVLAGFMVIIVSANSAPSSRPLRRLLPLAAAYSIFMSAVLWLIADPITGAVEGHFWELWGSGAVAIFCVSMFATIFERLIGMLAVIPAVGVLMFAGVPSSNGALSQYMAPTFFASLHTYLPMPAAVETIRSILYFDGAGVAEHLQVLGLWGLVSLVVVFLIDSLKPVRTTHDFGDLAPEPLPAATVEPFEEAGPAAALEEDTRELEPVGV